MSCTETIVEYGLRAIGIGERLLPKADITLCEQFVLIGSGMIWNLYFALFALAFGFLPQPALRWRGQVRNRCCNSRPRRSSL